jgi:hypothetical protein
VMTAVNRSTSLLNWIGRLARWRVTTFVIAIGVAVYGVVQRCSGLGRSLWLDEAWVANSVLTPSLKAMFYYDAWLQSSPPLFLLLVRAVVSHLGPSNLAFRLIPLLMGIMGLLAMFVFAARALSRQHALLAFTLLALSPVAVDYSKEFKQYSSELAVSCTILLVCTLYIERATVRRFWLLVATVTIGLILGYATAFILPGLVVVVCMTQIRHDKSFHDAGSVSRRFARAFVLALAAGAVLLSEYALLIKQNSPAKIRASFTKRSIQSDSARLLASDSYRLLREFPLNHVLRRQSLLLGVVGVIFAIGFLLAWLRFRKGRRKWFELQVFCLTPCVLLMISDRFSWYLFTERTSEFLLPFVIVLIVSSLQLIYLFTTSIRRYPLRVLLDISLLGMVVLTIHASRHTYLDAPREDVDGAVVFLGANVHPNDFLWVHASCSEAFRLYARMDKWQDAPVTYGHTGWPCCARGISNASDTFGEALVRDDFGGKLPVDFQGRVWLLYTLRAGHWFNKPDEPLFMRRILRERGCVELQTPAFTNIAVGSFECRGHASIASVAFDR